MPARAASPWHQTRSSMRYHPGQMAPALQITDLVKRYPTGTEALKGVSLEIARGRVLRPARAQRRRQVDADPLHDRARAADRPASIRVFGHDADRPLRGGARWRSGSRRRTSTSTGSSPSRRRSTTTAATSGCRARERRERATELLDDVLADGQARRPHAHAVGRHEAAADPRARADAPAAAADPRRADRRRRRRAAARAVALRPAHQRRGHDDPAHHALPRRGRAAVQPDRLHQRRRDRRARARAASSPRRTASSSLEDAYLELVGRKELSRAHDRSGDAT